MSEDAQAEVVYESPGPEERRAMDGGDMQAPRVPVDDGPMEDFEVRRVPDPDGERRRIARQVRDAEREANAEARRGQSNRTTAIHLAVEWTVNDREVQVGQLLGFADLFAQYIETGKKPTEAELRHAMELYR